MVARRSGPFGPGLLKFLRELEKNNNRGWFERNKQRYEDEVREPALHFIRQMAPHVERISPHLLARDKKVGGSLMRVHRDVRFSKDKSPYKTNLGIQFRHEAGKDVHAPGLYFHVQPGNCFLGAGMWHPDAPSLTAIRQAIDEEPKGWKRVSRAKRLRDYWEPSGESLKRPPRGYDVDHPLIEDLKRKDHISVCNLRPSDVSDPDLIDLVSERFRRTKPFLDWLATTLGMPF